MLLDAGSEFDKVAGCGGKEGDRGSGLFWATWISESRIAGLLCMRLDFVLAQSQCMT